MATDAAAARAMLAAAQRHPDLVAQVVPSPRTLIVDPVVQGLLEEGALGRLLAVNVHWAKAEFVQPDAPLHWRHDVARSGHNVIDLGLAYESLLRWVGPARSVLAAGAVHVPVRHDDVTGRDVAVEIPDHLDVLAELPGGASAHLQVSTVTGHAPPPAFWLHGSEATLWVGLEPPALALGRRGEAALQPLATDPGGRPAPSASRRTSSPRSAASGPIGPTTFADGVQYMEFTDAVHAQPALRAPRARPPAATAPARKGTDRVDHHRAPRPHDVRGRQRAAHPRPGAGLLRRRRARGRTPRGRQRHRRHPACRGPRVRRVRVRRRARS